MLSKIRLSIAAMLVLQTISLFADQTAISTPCVIYANPAASIHWKTMTANPSSLALAWPAGATSATLTVTKGSASDSLDIADTTLTSVPLEVVFPGDEKSECVVELTLVFKDAQDAVLDTQTARLGLVRGIGTATARCVLDPTIRKWFVVKDSAVVRIPEDATSLTLNDVPVEPLDAPGWWQWQVAENGDCTLAMTTEKGISQVKLLGRLTGGLILTVR